MWERNIDIREKHLNWLLLVCTLTRDPTRNIGMCLTGNQMCYLSVYGTMLQPTGLHQPGLCYYTFIWLGSTAHYLHQQHHKMQLMLCTSTLRPLWLLPHNRNFSVPLLCSGTCHTCGPLLIKTLSCDAWLYLNTSSIGK